MTQKERESDEYRQYYREKTEAAELILAQSFADKDELMPEELIVYKGLLAALAKRYVSETRG